MEQLIKTVEDIFSLIGLDGKISVLLSALFIFVIGRIVAKSLKKLTYKLLKKTTWDEKLLGENIGGTDANTFIASFVYFVVLLFVLMLVLSTLGLESVLDPVKNLLDSLLGFLPNIIAAAVIGFIGYIIAKVASSLIGMGSTLLNKVATKLKITDTTRIAVILQKVVFIVILIPFIIQALNSLEINAISEPANNILNSVLGTLPNILAAIVIITLFVVGGKYLTNFLSELLTSLGADNLVQKMHLGQVIGENQSISKLVGGLLYFYIVYFGILTGIEKLGLVQLNEILSSLLELSGQILFGLVILAIGNFIASMFYKVLAKSEENKFIASIAKGAILALFVAISLRTMGIANSIVELAFGLTFGAIAVVIALAYGLGGREAAGEHMKEIIQKFKK